MRTLRIYSRNNFPISYSSVNYSHHVVHYIPSPYLSYNGSLYHLTTFLQYPLPPHPASGNQPQISSLSLNLVGNFCLFIFI